jgi:peroxiredoxin (alkyl hydroperoxide reductase subunit C)
MGIYMDFPIIADLDMSVSKKYGMVHPSESETAAVRAVFFIDPKGIIRLILYYPLNIGRNMEEIKRVLIALQTADTYQCALPVNWQKGEKAIVPPPKNLKEMEERLKDNTLEKVDFYLAKKSLN